MGVITFAGGINITLAWDIDITPRGDITAWPGKMLAKIKNLAIIEKEFWPAQGDLRLQVQP